MLKDYGIDVGASQDGEFFVVRYAEPDLVMEGRVWDGERLRLAVDRTPGALASEPREIGYDSCSDTEFSTDGENHYECSLAPTLANVRALVAAGFPWSPAARLLAERVGALAQALDEVRAAIAAVDEALAAEEAWGRRKQEENRLEIARLWAELSPPQQASPVWWRRWIGHLIGRRNG